MSAPRGGDVGPPSRRAFWSMQPSGDSTGADHMGTYTKQDLTLELAEGVGISRRKANILLDHLAQIAYRESGREGFTVPGICRMDVVRRRERKARNPRTGELLRIGAHDALRVRPLKRARHQVAPPRPDLVTVLTSEEQTPPPTHEEPAPSAAAVPGFEPSAFTPPAAAPVFEPPPAVEPPPADVAPPPVTAPGPAAWQPLMEPAFASEPEPPGEAPGSEKVISFRCKNPDCAQEIEAPEDMAGNSDDCPACGAPIEVPYVSEPGTLHGPDIRQETEDAPPTMGRTIRIELPDDEDPFE